MTGRPPTSRLSVPAEAWTASQSASASSRRRFIRHSSRLSGSTARCRSLPEHPYEADQRRMLPLQNTRGRNVHQPDVVDCPLTGGLFGQAEHRLADRVEQLLFPRLLLFGERLALGLGLEQAISLPRLL